MGRQDAPVQLFYEFNLDFIGQMPTVTYGRDSFDGPTGRASLKLVKLTLRLFVFFFTH